jgi:hypothetical protein
VRHVIIAISVTAEPIMSFQILLLITHSTVEQQCDQDRFIDKRLQPTNWFAAIARGVDAAISPLGNREIVL